MIIVELIFNLAILVSVSILSGFIDKRWKRDTTGGKVWQGILFGLVCLVGMMNPFVLTPGIIFDGRSVVLSLCALFFGPLSALIATVFALTYRIWLGGGGVVMGVSVILASSLIGLLFHRRPDHEKFLGRTYYLYGVGLIVHVVMLLLMFTVPSNMRSTAFRTLSISIMGIYPVATALIGKILNDQAESSRKREAEEALRQSERRFALFMEHMPVFTFIKDHAFRLIYANPRMNETLGSDAWIGKLPQECFPGEAGERICRDDKQAMEAGLVHVIEVFPDMNGVERTYETLKFVIPDQDKGDMLGGIAMDITERRRAEEALNKKARELESFNSLMIGRELRMIELKKEINAFLAESGREAKYVIHE